MGPFFGGRWVRFIPAPKADSFTVISNVKHDIPRGGITRRLTDILPAGFVLEQNYPNPFNLSTTIRFRIAQPGHTKLTIVNHLGQQVSTLFDDNMEASERIIKWDGCSDDGFKVPSGIFWYRLESGDQVQTKKLLLLK